MASRSRNGGRHTNLTPALDDMRYDLRYGNRKARRRAAALCNAKYAETRTCPRKAGRH